MRAHLIHPVAIGITRLNRGVANDDEVFGGPAPTDETELGDGELTYYAPVYIDGQVKRVKTESLVVGAGGEVPEELGHINFEQDDLDAIGLTLQKQDRIISIAGVAKELYIIELEPCGTYDGETTMLRAVYSSTPKGV